MDMKTRTWRIGIGVLLALTVGLLVLASVSAGAAPAQPSAQAVRAAGPVTIDGVLDDAAWGAAAWNDDFTSSSAGPDNSGDPHRSAVQTRFKVLYDDWA